VTAAVAQRPVVESLDVAPDPVIRPGTTTLTAGGVSDADGQVVKVEFYRDTNGNRQLDVATDALLGTDTDSSDGWTWNGSTELLPTGVNRYFARAQDNDGLWSDVAAATGTVTLPGEDTNVPQALLLQPLPPGTNTISVRYTDDVAIDVSSLDTGDIRVTGKTNGFNQLARFESFSPAAGGNSVTAIYRITPPGPDARWDATDNDVYMVLMVARQVRDTGGRFVADGLLGEFEVNLPASGAVQSQADVVDRIDLASVSASDPGYFDGFDGVDLAFEMLMSRSFNRDTERAPGGAEIDAALTAMEFSIPF
jgi:hypothetical protein